MSLANRRTDRFACLEQFSSSIDKVPFTKNSMSLGLVVLEEKLFASMRTTKPQSDNIMSADKSADIIRQRHKIGYFMTPV